MCYFSNVILKKITQALQEFAILNKFVVIKLIANIWFNRRTGFGDWRKILLFWALLSYAGD